MKNIEQTIVELGSIFQQLAHMVKEQEEVVQRWVLHLWPYWLISAYVIVLSKLFRGVLSITHSDLAEAFTKATVKI